MKAKCYKIVDKSGNLISNISCTETVKEKIAQTMPEYDIIEIQNDEGAKHDDR